MNYHPDGRHEIDIDSVESKFTPRAIMDVREGQNIQIDARIIGHGDSDVGNLTVIIERTYLAYTSPRAQTSDGRPLISLQETQSLLPEGDKEPHIVSEETYHLPRPDPGERVIDYCRAHHTENPNEVIRDAYRRATQEKIWCAECGNPVFWEYHTASDRDIRFFPCGHGAYGNRLNEDPETAEPERGSPVNLDDIYSGDSEAEWATRASMNNMGQLIESLKPGDSFIFNERVLECHIIDDSIDFTNDRLPHRDDIIRYFIGPNGAEYVMLVTRHSNDENTSYERPRVYSLIGSDDSTLEILDNIDRIAVLSRKEEKESGNLRKICQ